MFFQQYWVEMLVDHEDDYDYFNYLNIISGTASDFEDGFSAEFGNNDYYIDEIQLRCEDILQLPGFKDFQWPSTAYAETIFGNNTWDGPSKEELANWNAESATKKTNQCSSDSRRLSKKRKLCSPIPSEDNQDEPVVVQQDAVVEVNLEELGEIQVGNAIDFDSSQHLIQYPNSFIGFLPGFCYTPFIPGRPFESKTTMNTDVSLIGGQILTPAEQLRKLVLGETGVRNVPIRAQRSVSASWIYGLHLNGNGHANSFIRASVSDENCGQHVGYQQHQPNAYEYYDESSTYQFPTKMFGEQDEKVKKVCNKNGNKNNQSSTNSEIKIVHASFSAKTLEVKPNLDSAKFLRRNSTGSFPEYASTSALGHLKEEIAENNELSESSEAEPKVENKIPVLAPSNSKKPRPIIEIREGDDILTRDGQKREFLCVFCKSNGEPESVYSSHPIRVNGVVMCPFLRNHTCVICKETGHTIKYCKVNKRGFFAMKSIGKADIFLTAEKAKLAHATTSALLEATNLGKIVIDGIRKNETKASAVTTGHGQDQQSRTSTDAIATPASARLNNRRLTRGSENRSSNYNENLRLYTTQMNTPFMSAQQLPPTALQNVRKALFQKQFF